MYFPISDVTINPVLLMVIGFVVGILGGFFGVGGGFLAGPMMFWSGMPMNYVVGTDLAHITGKSIVAARRHSVLGHIDYRLGFLMVIGTVVGIEIGALIIEELERVGNIDWVIGWIYIIILIIISGFTFWESRRAMQNQSQQSSDQNDLIAFPVIVRWLKKVRIKPYIDLPRSNISGMSVWVIIGVSLITGVLSGMLGVGGGFIRMPMLIYVLGVPTHVAVGTDLFEVIISGGYGTITHALKGNVDILIALLMQTGAALGAQIGATATKFIQGPKIRFFFSFLPLIGAIMVIIRLTGDMH